MKVKRIRTLNGPNIYSYRPVLVMQFELDEADEKNLSENHGFIERLEDLTGRQHLPLRKMRRIRTAENDLAEAVKNAALGLLNLVGFDAVGSVRFSGDANIYEIAVESTSESGGKFLLETAVDVVEAALNNQSFSVFAKIAEARALAETFDPATLASRNTRGLQPDPAQALQWYRRAEELGATELAPRIARLETAR